MRERSREPAALADQTEGLRMENEAMSTTEPNDQEPSDNPSEGDDETVQIEQELTLIAYADEGLDCHAYGRANKRDFANIVDPSTDYHEEETKTEVTHYIVFEQTGERVQVQESEYARVSEMVAQEKLDDVHVEKEQDEYTNHAHPTYRAGRNFRDRVTEQLPDEIGPLHLNDIGTQYINEIDDCVCQMNAALDRSRVLAHHTERSEDDRYETDAKRRNVTVNLSIGPVHPDVVDAVKDDLVAEWYDILGDEDWVEKVRVAECEVTKKGDCFV